MAVKSFVLPLVLGSGVLLGACVAPLKAVETTPVRQSATASATPVSTGQTLLTVRYTGGMCPHGACDTLVTLRRDGGFTRTSAQTGTKEGTIPPSQVAALTRETAAADFARVKSVKFTGTCPTAYDGQELTYTFYTASGLETIASCQVAIDEASPLFVAVQAMLDTVNRE